MLIHSINTVPHKLDSFFHKLIPQISASVPNISWTAMGQFIFPPVEPTVPVLPTTCQQAVDTSIDAHVADHKRVPDLKIHKAFPLYYGINGVDEKVFSTFRSRQSVYQGDSYTDKTELRHYSDPRGLYGNYRIPEIPTTCDLRFGLVE